MKAPKFSREQLTYLVSLAISISLDKIESSLPYNTSEEDWERLKTEENWIDYCAETAGRFLSCLYAQTTGDGMGTGDAVDIPKANILKFLAAFPVIQIKYWNSVVVPAMKKPDYRGTAGYAPAYRDDKVDAMAKRWLAAVRL